jgi:hypothetical protein
MVSAACTRLQLEAIEANDRVLMRTAGRVLVSNDIWAGLVVGRLCGAGAGADTVAVEEEAEEEAL